MKGSLVEVQVMMSIMPKAELDHLVVIAKSLEEGSVFVREHLGLEMQPGGRHERMGTHNTLLRIGTRSYLEVIAVDRLGIKPAMPRWFDLDTFQGAPRLAHWVVRVPAENLEQLRLPEHGPVHAMTRGPFSWRITIPTDGSLPTAGLIPTLIAWDSTSSHPCDVLEPSGCRLIRLEGSHPAADQVAMQIAALGLEGLIELETGPVSLRAILQIASKNRFIS
jgi:Glyoxalase-like domain